MNESENNESKLINDQIAKVLARAYPPVVMTLTDIANLLGLSYAYTKGVLQNEPEFPKRLDRFKSPRWRRDDVMKWADVL